MLYDATVGGQIAAQHGEAALFLHRVVDGPDDLVVVDARERLTEGATADSGAVDMQHLPESREQAPQTTGVIEVLHQVFTARTYVGENGYAAGDLVEATEVQCYAAAAGQGDEMDEGVGRAAQDHDGRNGVLVGALVQDVRGFEIFPDHLDDPSSAHRSHPGVAGVGCGNGGGSRERHAKDFGHGGHRRGPPHGHTVAGRAGDAVF